MFLTPAELVAFTGLRRPSAQFRWLELAGWPVQRDARGRPLVLRSVVESRLGATVTQAPPAPEVELPGLLTLSELRALPEAGEGAGVYFLWQRDELMYVGRSWCVINRVERHRASLRIGFDRATYIHVPTPDDMETWAVHMELDRIEWTYINAYQPPQNVAGVNRQIRIAV